MGGDHDGEPRASGRGGRASPGRRPFTFVARTSAASPRLFLACAKGHLKKGVLHARRFPLDVVDLEYGAPTISYRPQRPDGSLGVPVTAGFDLIRNAAT